MKTPKTKSEREDRLRNSALVRKAMVAHLKKYKMPPTVQDLVAATGLSDKTVKAHRERIPLGSGKANVYQQLTGDVLLALHARAVGYSHRAVKILAVSQGKGMASVVEQIPYTEHYPPDAAAAKLWLQTVEGLSEKQEVKHSGEIKNPGPPAIIQVQRYQAPNDNAL
ncbi:hypothetical protein GKZ68_10375 [Hymenobacter sp. BRD128]|uniref:hypothetical protein n=1 Tax=Hymenobacter sp. BRD128 TaxID=2675878 RepID=UPI0015640C90|nr:hypothetical protein [Hymenobacter sp. BRD128]QKG56995.1 hypothetical protein GKZ68_10375 [Hymenobacter sp. BRD128]